MLKKTTGGSLNVFKGFVFSCMNRWCVPVRIVFICKEENKPRANPLHQHHTPLKKRLRIKEIFDDAVKLDVHGRPKSPFKEV